jgi:hypothetical protein
VDFREIKEFGLEEPVRLNFKGSASDKDSAMCAADRKLGEDGRRASCEGAVRSARWASYPRRRTRLRTLR